jgi:3-oxoacyl-[acyl-carrier protein] reductase
MIDLKRKKVLITGGSRGIGEACVKIFAEANAQVAFTYVKNKHKADEIVWLLKSTGSIVKAYCIDLGIPEEIEKTHKSILKDFDGIDILVNNAGIWKYGKIDEMTLQQWEETININLTAAFLFTKAVLPYMKKNRFGRIINISSTAGQRGEAFYSHYAASKGGLISFTKSLAAELGEFNITVNSVAPGWVDTDMVSDVFSDKEYKEKVRQGIPLKRIASPDDIAGPVLFLASNLANHITGEVLNVNGGSVLCG